MTVRHDGYPKVSANGASPARCGSNPADDAERLKERWPPLRAYLVVSFLGLLLWLAIAAGLWFML